MTEMFLVGGAVRDRLMGGKMRYDDLDFTVEGLESYADMKRWLADEWGVEAYHDTPEHFTMRGHFTPKQSGNYVATRYFHDYVLGNLPGDFVLARQDGKYTDGRRPDSVSVGLLEDDLARRDFTVNAMAMNSSGYIIDPFNGQRDLKRGVLKAVGDPKERLAEDALRVVRALRFSVTKDLFIDTELRNAMNTKFVLDALADNIAADRIRKELHKMFVFDQVKTLDLLHEFRDIRKVILDKGIWLKPTEEKQK